MFNKISTVKEKVERAKYSKLIICPLIKYIYFRIKSKLERKELMDSKKICNVGFINTEQNKTGKVFF